MCTNPHLPIERSSHIVSIETTSVSLEVDLEAAGHLACIDHQYATLMSPNQGKTAVCGSFIMHLLDDWGGDHWLPQIRLRVPWPWFQFY